MVAAQTELKAKAKKAGKAKAEEFVAEMPGSRVVLQGISWRTYESFLADYENHAGPRFYYDNGTMEIKMPSFKHEEENRTLMLLIELLAIELGIDLRRFGSATFKRDDLLKGFEPDSCFTFRTPKPSIQAIDPPPAPIDVTSTAGMITGKFPTWFSVEKRGSPSMMEMSVLVPPMSIVMRRWKPAARATKAAPMAPAAGPDIRVSVGRSAASLAVITPPLDLVLRTGVER